MTSRHDAVYDSEACRARAYRLRHKSKNHVESKRLDAGSVQDVNSLRRLSPMAADLVLKVSYLYTPDLAQELLDAIFDVAVNVGGSKVFGLE